MTEVSLGSVPGQLAPGKQKRVRRPSEVIQGGKVETFLTGYLPMIAATLIVALPLVWMVLGSLKTPAEIVTTDLVLLPQQPSLEAYAEASRRVDFPRLFANSLLVTTIGSTIKVILAITSAYALVFVRFPFKKVIFLAILVALMVPPQVSLLPNFVLIAELGGLNTYWGIILPGLGTAFGTFLLRQQFLALPSEIMESAEMDGAGHLTRMLRIAVPISTPTIATVTLVTLVNEWNDYIWPLVITSDDKLMTLPVGLSLLRSIESDARVYPILMAGSVLVIVPVLIVFAFLQRYIVAGLTQGAVR